MPPPEPLESSGDPGQGQAPVSAPTKHRLSLCTVLQGQLDASSLQGHVSDLSQTFHDSLLSYKDIIADLKASR